MEKNMKKKVSIATIAFVGIITTIKLAMKAEDYSSIKTYIFYVSNDYQSTPDTNNL